MTASVHSIALAPFKALAHLAALPVRAAARVRRPAVTTPARLAPGDRPAVGGALLLLFDGGCGICLHARDLFVLADRGGRLAQDRIARHDRGLLAGLSQEDRYGSWHVVYPDGRMESGGAGLAAAIALLPAGRPLAALLRRFPTATDGLYQWFADNRSWISQGSGLIEHPQRDPREQPDHPHHEDVI